MEKLSTWGYAAAMTSEFYWWLLWCEICFSPTSILGMGSARLEWSSAVAWVAGCFPFSALPPPGCGPRACGPMWYSGYQLPVLSKRGVSRTTPPLSSLWWSKNRHTPLPLTSPGHTWLHKNPGMNSLFWVAVCSTKSQRLYYSRKGSTGIGEQLTGAVTVQPMSQMVQKGGSEPGGRDKFMQEDCVSKLTVSVREFLG